MKDTSKPLNLTKKQDKQYRTFAQNYIIRFNGKEAAIQAGYSEKTAASQASRLLTHVKVQEYIRFYIKEREKRTEITGDKVVQEIAKTAFMRESDFYHDNGDVKQLSELTDNQKSALSSYGLKSIHIGDGEYIEIPVFKAQDKTKSLELLGKHFGIFEKDNTQKPVGSTTVVNIVEDKRDD
jgi:phage terminase small subunit